MKTKLLLLAALWLTGANAPAQINVRISVKAVLNPATGMRQPGVTEATFSNTVAGMNALLDQTGRGYRLQWNGTIQNVGGLNQYNSGPSQYYDLDFHDPDNTGMKEQMNDDAINNPASFGWSSSSVNIYIVRYGGANWNVCSFPSSGSILIVNGNAGYAKDTTVLHETGHFFNLSHTMNGEKFLNANASNCTNTCACALLVGGGNDGVNDTILDHECWDSQNLIAQGNYGANYVNLTASQKTAVDRIWWNIMSYHGRDHEVDRFTSDQLDRWADAANTDRISTVTGRTRFVDRDNNGIQAGSSGLPWKTVATGIGAASASGDIVLIRPGNYNEPMTVTKAVTLRATRGTAVIGLP